CIGVGERQRATKKIVVRSHIAMSADERGLQEGTAEFYCTASTGRKIQKHVPWGRDCVLLWKWMLPPCFLTIPSATHRPRLVPLSALVVKNASKTLPRCSGGMPDPLSAIVTRTCGIPN